MSVSKPTQKRIGRLHFMKKRLQKIKDRLIKNKISNFEIYLERSWGTSLEVKEGELDSLEHEDSLGFGLRILDNHAFGFSYGTDFSDSAIDFVIKQASAVGKFQTPDPRYQLVKPQPNYSSLKNWDDNLPQLKPQEKIDLALRMEAAALKVGKKVKRVSQASFSETLEECYLYNSQGLDLFHKQTLVSLSVMPLAEAKGESELGYESYASPYIQDLNPEELGRSSAEYAVQMLGGKRTRNFRGPILLSRYVAAEVIEILAPSVLSENIHKKNSYLEGKLGEKVYSDKVTFIDDGLHPKGSMSRPFDGEGMPQQKNTVIEKGTVKQFLYDSYWAARDNVDSTGNGLRDGPLDIPSLDMSNFYLVPGERSFEELIKSMNNGVIVTEMIGLHTADSISGDYSVGIQGLKVKNGEVDHPLRSMVLTGNLHENFEQIVEVGSDFRFSGNMGSASILIEEGLVSGE